MRSSTRQDVLPLFELVHAQKLEPAPDHYILIDYENVPKVDLGYLARQAVKVVIFVGKFQKSVPLDLLKKACALKGYVEIVESSVTAKNALDFEIACYAGRLMERAPYSAIHFVSKDKGFDNVVNYILAEKRAASRVDTIDKLPFVTAVEPIQVTFQSQPQSKPKTDAKSHLAKPRTPEPVSASVSAPPPQVTAGLSEFTRSALVRLSRMRPDCRPKTLKRLQSSVKSMFQKEVPAKLLPMIVEELIAAGKVVVDRTRVVSYHLDPGSVTPPGGPLDSLEPW